MRKRHSRRQSGGIAEINMTPLIDMVFILLIFFIVTASFVKETGLEIQKPKAHSAISIERASILIAIGEDGSVWIDNRQIEIQAVRVNVERMISENPEGSVVIQADRRSKNGILLTVMDAAKLAGAKEVSISTEDM